MIFFPEAGFGIFYIDDACKSLIFHRIFAGLDYTWPIYGSGCAHMAVWHPRRRTKQFWFNDSKTRIIVGTYEQFNSFPEVPHPRAKVRLSLAVACLHGSVASRMPLPPQCGTWHAQIEHDLAPDQPTLSDALSHQHTRKLNLPSSIVHFFPQGPSTHGQSASVPVCGCQHWQPQWLLCLHGSVATPSVSCVTATTSVRLWHVPIDSHVARGPWQGDTLSHQHTRKLNLPSSIVHFFPQGPSKCVCPSVWLSTLAAAVASVPMAVWQAWQCGNPERATATATSVRLWHVPVHSHVARGPWQGDDEPVH
jgi:hypothetical protein